MQCLKLKSSTGLTTSLKPLERFLLLLLQLLFKEAAVTLNRVFFGRNRSASLHADHLLHQVPVMVHWCFCREVCWNVSLLGRSSVYIYTQKLATLLALEPHTAAECIRSVLPACCVYIQGWFYEQENVTLLYLMKLLLLNYNRTQYMRFKDGISCFSTSVNKLHTV